MSGIRTVVTFESPAFNTTARKDYFINDCCHGDDVARTLMERLRAGGIPTDGEPGQEDFGWYFGFRTGGTAYQFVLGHRPGGDSEPAVWIGWLERKAGLTGTILGARKRGIQPAGGRAVHAAIAALPQVSGIRWHRKEDFDAGREALGKPDPEDDPDQPCPP